MDMDNYSVPCDRLVYFRNTVVHIFNRRDMKKSLHELGRQFLYPHGHLDCIAKKGKELASRLFVPSRLMSGLMDLLRSMARQVFNWYLKNRYFISDDFDVLSSFHWRADGTLDELKTAQALVQRQDADISSRFKIASSYVWLDDMQRLRQESPNTCEGLSASFQQGTMMNYWEGRHASMSSPVSNSGQTMIIEGHCCICGNVSEEI
ncbi:hypothetical protein CDAR_102171 [Caerostris darwini]|uniref:Uncharacterized protein n=1 Tax=Caerostris darwini TaxID=1538125 RepID=A0AAV4UP24_9ARAC|nr:hypothetical protein CDAR_102171 [Caerostris darwini]